MKSMKLHAAALAAALLPALAFAQDAAPSDALKASQEQADAYLAAFNKGDAKAVAALYAEDARFHADDGSATGRAAIQDELAAFFVKNKGAKLALSIDAARFLTPDVLIEDGTSAVGDGMTRYTVTYVKKAGKWLIADLTETALAAPDAAPDAAAQALGELAWMAGSWQDKSSGAKVETRVDWTKNGSFLRRSFTVTRENEEPVEGTELIGYDATSGQVRSWVFDSAGGFGEGLWRREGNKWLVHAKATAPDGSVSTAQHVITHIDDKKFTWESINRQSGGEALPNLDKVEVIRVANRQP